MTRHAWIWAAATALCAALMLPAQKVDSAESMLQAATKKELVDGNLTAAIEGYKKALTAAGSNRAVAAKALLHLGQCYEKQGNAEARRAYERLVKEFSDQKEQARDAGARLAAMGRTASDSQAMVAELIAKGSGLDLEGRVTQDGRLYPFIDPATGDVAVRDLRTGAVKRLTNEGTRAQHGEAEGATPIPSRDGKQIAYLWRLKAGAIELRVMNVDGGGVRTVPVKLKTYEYSMKLWDWSPDGKRVLVDGFQEEWAGIATIELASGEVHQFASRFGSDVGGFSPDGRWVVYSGPAGFDDSDWDIFAIDTQTGHEAIVVMGAGADREPMWVPDSDKIVFRSDRNGRNAIWMVRFKDGQAGAPVLIKPDAGDYAAKGMSRDGSFFYGVRHEPVDVYRATVDPETLRVQDTPARVIETYRGENSMPSWSPSGDSFAYFSKRDNTFRLVVHHPDGKETVMAEPGEWPNLPLWCGGGDRITAWGMPNDGLLQLFDPRTGNASPAMEVKGPFMGSFQITFSPDCKSAYVSAESSPAGTRLISRYDFSTDKQTELLRDAGDWAVAPRVSPDGRWLALLGNLPGGNGRGVLLLSTEGGPLRTLDEHDVGSAGDQEHTMAWSPDSKRLMYVRSVKLPNGQESEDEVYWVSVDGGTPQPMGIRMTVAMAPSLNPDGRRILFSAGESTGEFWVLRNLPLNQGEEPSSGKANEPQLVTQGLAREFGNRITPDGKLFPVVDRDTGDIGLRDLRPGQVRPVTHDGKPGQGAVGAGTVTPSRDGKQLAYGWTTGEGQVGLRVIGIEGSGPRIVPVKPQKQLAVVDWSPDGKQVLVQMQEGGGGWQGVGTVDLATGEVDRLISCSDPPATSKCPWQGDIGGFSLDGRWIVYTRRVARPGAPPRLGIFALDRQTGAETALFQEPGGDQLPRWVAGTDKILFLTYSYGKYDLYMVRFQAGSAAGPPALIRHDVGSGYAPKGIGLDGSLLYGLSLPKQDVYQATVDPVTLRVLDAPKRLVDTYLGGNSRPTWSPRGDSFAYLSRRAGRNDDRPWRLVIGRPDGKELVVAQSARVAEDFYRPLWVLGGESVFVTYGGVHDGQTGKPSPLVLQYNTRAVSPDGKWAYFCNFVPPFASAIQKVEIATGKQSELLADSPGLVSGLHVSPDGRWLAFGGAREGTAGSGLMLLPTAGGPVRILDESPIDPQGITWAPDSKRLLYARLKPQFWENELYWVAVEGGAPQSMGLSMPGASAASLHPDGRRILFSATEDIEELWVLRNLPLK